MTGPCMTHRMTAIVDCFADAAHRLGLVELAAGAGLPTSTTHRILDQLIDLGWVHHDATGYALGWRAHRLSERVDPTALLREAAAPHIEQFVRQTPFVVHLAVLEGSYVRYLDKAGGRPAVRVPSRVGGLLPAHLTAVGKAMLAYVPAAALDTALEQAVADGEGPPVDLPGMHRELARVRAGGGLATDCSSSLASVACVGAPIFATGGRVIGALSLCNDSTDQALDRFGPALRERARLISAAVSGGRHAAG